MMISMMQKFQRYEMLLALSDIVLPKSVPTGKIFSTEDLLLFISVLPATISKLDLR